MRRKPECHLCECGDHAWARTSRWGVVLVDVQDKQLLEESPWSLAVASGNKTAYAHRNRDKWDTYILHRAVLGLRGVAAYGDHKNGIGLDCRRRNLRSCTPAQNTYNRSKKRNSASRFLGVSYSGITPKKPWFARIKNSKTVYNIGRFESEDDAAIAYNVHASYLHADFARLNQSAKWGHD